MKIEVLNRQIKKFKASVKVYLNICTKKSFVILIFFIATILSSCNENPKTVVINKRISKSSAHERNDFHDRAVDKSPGIIDTFFICQINSSLPKYKFKCYEYTEWDSILDLRKPYKFKVEVFRLDKDSILQTIESETNTLMNIWDFNYGADENSDIDIDINFDGYKDIHFKSGEGANRYTINGTYDFYIYNPVTGKFVYNESVSSLINPTPLPDKNIVCSYQRSYLPDNDDDDLIEEYYKWEDSVLTLIPPEKRD